MWPYASEAEALTDVLRLAKGMTYKAAMARLPFGGGKTVIIGDPRTDKSRGAVPRARPRDRQPRRPLLHRRGRRHQPGRHGLGGRRDALRAGPHAAAAAATRRRSRRAASGSASAPRSGTGSGASDLAGVRVAVQGLGHVGYHVARLLAQDGARLIVADLDPARAERAAEEFGARVVG